ASTLRQIGHESANTGEIERLIGQKRGRGNAMDPRRQSCAHARVSLGYSVVRGVTNSNLRVLQHFALFPSLRTPTGIRRSRRSARIWHTLPCARFLPMPRQTPWSIVTSRLPAPKRSRLREKNEKSGPAS